MDYVRTARTAADILMGLIRELERLLDDIKFLLVGASLSGRLFQLGVTLPDDLIILLCELGETHASIPLLSVVSINMSADFLASTSCWWSIWKE